MKMVLHMNDAEVHSVLADHLWAALGDGWTVEGIELVRRKDGAFRAEAEICKGSGGVGSGRHRIEVGRSRMEELDALVRQRDNPD